MQKLSLLDAWNETAAFVKREGRLLFPVAFMLIAVPMALFAGLMPQPVNGHLPGAGAWTIALPVALVLGLAGQVAVSFLALRAGHSVGEAMKRAFARLLPLVLAALMIIAGLVLAFILAVIVAGLLTPGLAPDNQESVRRASLVIVLIMLPIILFFAARLLPLIPVAAAEEVGPVQMLRRCWALTAGRVGLLVGYVLLVLVLLLVVNFAVSSVAGSAIILAAGPIQPGSISYFLLLLVSAVLQTVVSVYTNVLNARIYAQLAESPINGI